jgi:hypothetical protein
MFTPWRAASWLSQTNDDRRLGESISASNRLRNRIVHRLPRPARLRRRRRAESAPGSALVSPQQLGKETRCLWWIKCSLQSTSRIAYHKFHVAKSAALYTLALSSIHSKNLPRQRLKRAVAPVAWKKFKRFVVKCSVIYLEVPLHGKLPARFVGEAL